MKKELFSDPRMSMRKKEHSGTPSTSVPQEQSKPIVSILIIID
jgi:hypothetical protein